MESNLLIVYRAVKIEDRGIVLQQLSQQYYSNNYSVFVSYKTSLKEYTIIKVSRWMKFLVWLDFLVQINM